MNKFIIIILVFLFSFFANAQSLDKGRLQIKLGSAFYFGKRTSSIDFENVGNSLNADNSDRFFGRYNEFSLHYNTHKNFSFGLFLSNSNGLETDQDTSHFSTGAIGFSVQCYLINKPKFNLFFDARVGGLVYDEKTNANDFGEYEITGEGALNAFSIGANKYFGNVFGIYLKTGFMRQDFQLERYTRDDNDIEISSVNINRLTDIKTMFNGGFINFGLTVKLRNKSPKSE